MTEGHLNLLKFCAGDECLLQTAKMPGPPLSMSAHSQRVHQAFTFRQCHGMFNQTPQSGKLTYVVSSSQQTYYSGSIFAYCLCGSSQVL